MKSKYSIKKSVPALIGMAFLAAVVVYAVLVYSEKKALSKEEEVPVVVSATMIKKGFTTTNENKKTGLGVKTVPRSLLPERAYQNPEDMGVSIALINIPAGSILTYDMFESAESVTGDMKEPVLVGLKVDDLYQSAGGKLRSGDRIHIYLQGEDEQVKLRWSGIYVADAFDSGGNELYESDEGRAVRFNIYLEKSDVEEFYDGLDSKKLRIALALEREG